MSIQSQNIRYSVIIRSHMEIPIVKWNNLSLEDTIRFFCAKSKFLKSSTILYKEYMSIIKMLQIAQDSNVAKLETLYQKKYQVFIVLSFGTQVAAQHFQESIPEDAFFRSGLSIEIPMGFCIHIPTTSLSAAEANFKMSTQRTHNHTFRKELTDAKDLLNLAYTEFKGVLMETIYQENSRLTIVLSFQSDSDVDRFLVKLN